MEQHITEIVVRLVYQLSLILLVAKVGGEICVRYLKVPPVLGELAAGIIIGPFALGRIPTSGDVVSLNGLTIEVISTAGRSVRRVRVAQVE